MSGAEVTSRTYVFGTQAGVSRARSDSVLVREVRRGSAEAFDELFSRHWPMAHRAAALIVGDAATAEDVAQEAWLAAIDALDRFDRRRPFAPWLHRIVVNRAIDHARARARRRESVAAEPPELPGTAQAPPVGADERLAQALAGLAPDQRAVVVLRHVLEWTPGEIAGALGIPRGTVNSRLRRALDTLGEELGR